MEIWKTHLDKREPIGVILMELSKGIIHLAHMQHFPEN